MSATERESPGGHHTGTWVALLTSLIGAAAIITAAVIGVDAKRDRQAAAALLALKDSEIRRLQQQLQQTPPSDSGHRSSSTDNAGSREFPTQGSSEPTPRTVVQDKGFLIELKRCTLQNDELECKFLATAESEDTTLTLNSQSRVIESDGTVIEASRIQLANSQARGQFQFVRVGLVRNVPVQMSVTFAGLNPAISGKSVRLIELSLSGLAAQFHNVPVN